MWRSTWTPHSHLGRWLSRSCYCRYPIPLPRINKTTASNRHCMCRSVSPATPLLHTHQAALPFCLSGPCLCLAARHSLAAAIMSCLSCACMLLHLSGQSPYESGRVIVCLFLHPSSYASCIGSLPISLLALSMTVAPYFFPHADHVQHTHGNSQTSCKPMALPEASALAGGWIENRAER